MDVLRSEEDLKHLLLGLQLKVRGVSDDELPAHAFFDAVETIVKVWANVHGIKINRDVMECCEAGAITYSSGTRFNTLKFSCCVAVLDDGRHIHYTGTESRSLDGTLTFKIIDVKFEYVAREAKKLEAEGNAQ